MIGRSSENAKDVSPAAHSTPTRVTRRRRRCGPAGRGALARVSRLSSVQLCVWYLVVAYPTLLWCATVGCAEAPEIVPEGPGYRWLRIGCMGRATVFREFDITSPKLFTPTLTLFTAPWTGSI